MPQTKYDVSVTDKARADEIIKQAEEIKGVKFVNINPDNGSIVVTHSEDFDESAFKAVIGI